MSMAMARSVCAALLRTIFWFSISVTCYGTATDIECLRRIKNSLNDPFDTLKYSWNFSNKTEGFICRFNGVECWHPDENRVLNLRLSNMGLVGQFPLGLENCTSLTGLDLSSNNLSGSLPANNSQIIPYVTALDLPFNKFTGEIPVNLFNISYLNSLNLQNNRLSGQIHGRLTSLSRLKTLNVADNMLSGPIPPFSASFPAANFANNPGLCGKPLNNDCLSSKKSHTGMIIGFASGAVVFTITVVGVVLFFCLLKLPVNK